MPSIAELGLRALRQCVSDDRGQWPDRICCKQPVLVFFLRMLRRCRWSATYASINLQEYSNSLDGKHDCSFCPWALHVAYGKNVQASGMPSKLSWAFSGRSTLPDCPAESMRCLEARESSRGSYGGGRGLGCTAVLPITRDC